MNNRHLHLTMLGTGHAAVTKYYNTCFLLGENDHYFMVDAGGGNQVLRILEEKGIALDQIHDMFLTHAHSDHLLGAVWMVHMVGQLMLMGRYEGNFRIYASASLIENLKTICRIVLMDKITNLFGNRMELIPLQDGDSHRILDREITFFDIKAKKLLQYGFEIKEEGILFCGDEPLEKELYPKAEGVKYLMHEAFCMDAESEKFKPHEKHHSTVKDVCEMAETLQVENVILIHTEDSHVEDRKQLYIEEGNKFFSGTIFVPEDKEEIRLSHSVKS